MKSLVPIYSGGTPLKRRIIDALLYISSKIIESFSFFRNFMERKWFDVS